MAHVDYTYGSTSAYMARSDKGTGGSGGGKKPPLGGQGSRLPVSPTKKRAPPATRVVLEASKSLFPFLIGPELR
jgi:hypothetical protein